MSAGVQGAPAGGHSGVGGEGVATGDQRCQTLPAVSEVAGQD